MGRPLSHRDAETIVSFLSRRYARTHPGELEPQVAYTKWAESYPPQAHNALMRVEQSAMETLLRSLSVSRALDVGTGTGRYLDVLDDAGVPTRVGLDLSEAMLARARRGARPLVRSDALALPFASGAFDLVLASLMVGDIEDLGSWAREMSRVLRSGGSLLYSDFHPSWAERGWQRTFRTQDEVSWRVSYHPHTLEEHRVALERADVQIVSTTEPRIDLGRLQEDVCDGPVCVVILARKLGG